MAGLGGARQHTGNMERDFLVHARQSIGIPFEVFWVQTILRREDMVAEMGHRSLILPTDICSWLYNYQRDRFHFIMGTSSLASYWAHIQRADPEWFRHHPARDRIVKTGGIYDIPYGLFGDEAGLGKN